MGEMADDILDGTVYDMCGAFFAATDDDEMNGEAGTSHGHPATCWDCWKRMSKSERKDHRRATVPTI